MIFTIIPAIIDINGYLWNPNDCNIDEVIVKSDENITAGAKKDSKMLAFSTDSAFVNSIPRIGFDNTVKPSAQGIEMIATSLVDALSNTSIFLSLPCVFAADKAGTREVEIGVINVAGKWNNVTAKVV
jgi:hypothetical protein